jgi:hypothetical protein
MALGQGRHVWNVSQLATCPDLNPVMNQRVRCSLACSLKQEEIDGRNYRDLKRAREAIGVFIEDVYNRQRLHSARYAARYHNNSASPSSPWTST